MRGAYFWDVRSERPDCPVLADSGSHPAPADPKRLIHLLDFGPGLRHDYPAVFYPVPAEP